MDVAYDNFCPSLQKELPKRKCKHFNAYFTSAAAVQRHTRGQGCPSLFGMPIPRPAVMVLYEPDDFEVDDDDEDADNSDDNSDEDVMPVITIEDILNSPFIEIAMGEESHDEHDA